MLVVLSSGTGPEIFVMSTGFSEKRMLAARVGGFGDFGAMLEESLGASDFFRRRVKARAIDDMSRLWRIRIYGINLSTARAGRAGQGNG